MSMVTLFTDDLLAKFEEVQVTNLERIDESDRAECLKLEQLFKETASFMQTYLDFIERHEVKNEWFDSNKLSKEMTENLEDLTKRFIRNTVYHFEKKYDVQIDKESIISKYNHQISYEQIVDEIFLQLGGHSFQEKAITQLKDKLRKQFHEGYSEPELRNKKVVIQNYLSWNDWKLKSGNEYSLRYESKDKLMVLFEAVSHFETGNRGVIGSLNSLISGYDRYSKFQFEKFELDWLNKVQSFKPFKNRKVEIEFASHELAAQFIKDYCGRMGGEGV
ncbi:hypothetical protein P9G84_02515 [Brevibacillus centrosporus]|uniref:hypothetical protein n=1 Tax=Brevibacillus centrosporus TaxID=54910 RepID=UPI0011422007|nr:hypothetical protein [Brevibacillus centrosporus]MEC2127867.1 hypothetical protein [Brevibacillus centrosporus]GED32112.1 hypothetical protein BCE02nite_32530 [Brevibacillus centrosporus]